MLLHHSGSNTQMIQQQASIDDFLDLGNEKRGFAIAGDQSGVDPQNNTSDPDDDEEDHEELELKEIGTIEEESIRKK